MATFTPMMQQYLDTKEKYKDCILFYRLGDFYEMFFEDAKIVSKELELTLTGKSCGQEERAPMCGVPFHAAENYLNRLVQKGYKVAICEQVEDPKTAKGLVKRDVVRIVTMGTNLSTQVLDETKNNFIMCIYTQKGSYGVAVADISTGDFKTTQIENKDKLIDEICKFSPSEILSNIDLNTCGIPIALLAQKNQMSVTFEKEYLFDKDLSEKALKEHFNITNLEGLGLSDYPLGMQACGALISYFYETQKSTLNQLIGIEPYSTEAFLIIDSSSRRNLELCETMREKQKKGSLLWVLDKTRTAMGARMLRNWVEQPLVQKEEILKRYDAIGECLNNVMIREELREYLNSIYDLERLMSRICYKSANPRDLIAFKTSIAYLPSIKSLLNDLSKSELICSLNQKMDSLEDLFQLIDDAMIEECPISSKEGGMIKDGYNETLDALKKSKTDGKDWLAALEEKEKEATGIKNLKIKFNRVFGYYFEVTNSYKDLVPDYFVRKQTLANAERYTTKELDDLADIILGAEDKLFALEYEIFVSIREHLSSQVQRILDTAKAIARLDAVLSLAVISEQNSYVRPEINEEGIIDIKDGRHPVVEKMISNDMFVSNDTFLNQDANRISIITGPNMAGKSTYMRQSALIVLMAQIGCYVPASYANISLVDKIFTRVGASDDLASGQSTFMVEMSEVANILRNATKNSLLILDEIGRGTSTYDGLSIAWSVVEHISNELGAKTLFATHYHELTELEGRLTGVHNYCIAVKEEGDHIVFLRKIISGGADKSYGIQVAKLAGVPDSVIKRSKEIAKQLDDADLNKKVSSIELANGDSVKLMNKGSEEKVGYRENTVSEETVVLRGNSGFEETTALGENTVSKEMIALEEKVVFEENGILKENVVAKETQVTEKEKKNKKTKNSNEIQEQDHYQYSFIQSLVETEVINDLKMKDIGNITPLEALIFLNDLQKKLK